MSDFNSFQFDEKSREEPVEHNFRKRMPFCLLNLKRTIFDYKNVLCFQKFSDPDANFKPINVPHVQVQAKPITNSQLKPSTPTIAIISPTESSASSSLSSFGRFIKTDSLFHPHFKLKLP